MNKIQQLKNEITRIENNLDGEATKEELYDILVKAYFKAKDIIELYDNAEAIIDTETPKLKDSLDICLKEKDDLTSQLVTVNQELAIVKDKINTIKNVLQVK